jgi:Zn-dependent protease
MTAIISFLFLVIAITIHEFSHAKAADELGDPTPQANGRLTLNPLAHLDPLGTVMILFAHFGWGKPVPIDPYNFRSPRRDEIIVSLAGPGSNLLLALIIGLFQKFTNINSPYLYLFFLINVSLAVFNLLPIPPLDGSKIFLNLLPIDTAVRWQEAFDRYGFFLVAILLFLPFAGSNLINLIVSPIVSLLVNLLY